MKAGLALEAHFAEQLGIPALRPEAKLILLLSQQDCLSIKQAMSMSGLSYRGFYMLVTRLVEQGLIKVDTDAHDRRVRKIRLAPDLAAALRQSAMRAA